ncbi:unnamed protein product [Clonostachys rosea]|uniref:Uncharacterized protein n=1 Tax=Bionectria ochroleuca TaxID=29856 RepID=A0ABY6TWC7_BIOOC|nr:unnamed protein product [Clonostachys rosea]
MSTDSAFYFIGISTFWYYFFFALYGAYRTIATLIFVGHGASPCDRTCWAQLYVNMIGLQRGLGLVRESYTWLWKGFTVAEFTSLRAAEDLFRKLYLLGSTCASSLAISLLVMHLIISDSSCLIMSIAFLVFVKFQVTTVTHTFTTQYFALDYWQPMTIFELTDTLIKICFIGLFVASTVLIVFCIFKSGKGILHKMRGLFNNILTIIYNASILWHIGEATKSKTILYITDSLGDTLAYLKIAIYVSSIVYTIPTSFFLLSSLYGPSCTLVNHLVNKFLRGNRRPATEENAPDEMDEAGLNAKTPNEYGGEEA